MARGTLARYQRSMFSREGEDGGGGGQTGDPGKNLDGSPRTPPEEDGKPPKESKDDKSKKEFAPITSQEEFDRRVADRLKRERAKYADYDTYKAAYESWQQLEQESQTEAERREREIREEAWNEAMSKAVPIAVRQAFRVAAAGRMSSEQLASLLEDLDLVKYATDDGDPDEEKIERKIATIAPARQAPPPPGFGQGSGWQQSASSRPGEGGLAEARRRFPEAFASKS